MRNLKRMMISSCALSIFLSLTSCAAGSATAAYSLKAREADCLSASGEQRIVNRVKREMVNDFSDGTSGCENVSGRY